MRNHLSKKNWKLILLALGMLALTLVVTGCASTNGTSVAPISHTSGNWWDRYIVYYISQFILWIASLVHDSYGWAIIIFTIIVRIILLPLNAISIRSMAKQQKVLYKEAGINPYTGCLPMLIQLPVMYALYQAIWRTPQLQNGRFLWMDLGRPDPYYIMPILAAVFTFMSTYISQMSTPQSSQNGMTKGMTYLMPLIIGVSAIGIQSAISLYWVISNLFQVVQTFILQNPFKYQRELEEQKKEERERQRKVRRAYKRLGRKQQK